jgi:hypothetical protein
MSNLCPQLKQNIETIKTLKSELDLELPKLEELFKIFKNNTDSQSRKNNKAERKDLINKIKSLETEINLMTRIITEALPSKEIEIGNEFILKFKYSTLEDMLAEGGFNNSNVNTRINPMNFSTPREKELLNQSIRLKAKIFDFEEDVSSEDVLLELDKEGFRPATLVELLALAKIYHSSRAVASFGLMLKADNDSYVPYFFTNINGRKLDLHWFENGWNTSFHFLAVRKENN